ncbi:Ger(x)C family spore germination protein [Pseudalkalibacillus hwajinpoensis]|uniref:Ger(x)C family spore germination protein n=1 Tax=Guptibacillus hwajinpoensis TaxID=208199 RepID=UPI00325A74CC
MNRKLLSLLVCILIVLTACWDSNEIEDLGMIIGVGLDYKGGEEPFSMTNQYVVPNNIPGMQSGGALSNPYQNLTLNGKNFFEIIRENSLETDRPPNFTHLKSLVISDKILKQEPAHKIISFFLRDHEFRRTVPVFITKENVATIMNVEPTKEMFPAVQIKELTQNIDRSLHVQDNLTFGDLSEHISDRSSFVIPEIGINQNRVRLLGAAIISSEDYKLAGWLEPEEVGGLKWIKDTVKGGLVTIDREHSPEDQVVLEINEAKTKIEPVLKGDQLTININVNGSLKLAEDWNMERNVFKKGWDDAMKKDAEEIVSESMEQVIDIAQNDFKLDFLDLGTWVRINHPSYWKKNKDKWNTLFSEVPIHVDVNFKITGFGTQDLV